MTTPPARTRPSATKVLDATELFSEIREKYVSNPSNNTLNCLVIGNYGTGKTKLLETLPKPILLHSFDPGGSKTIAKMIADGDVLADTSFEMEDVGDRTTAYARWEKEFHKLKKAGVFDKIGTYVIDSFTTFSDSMLHEIGKRDGRQGAPPQLQDYNVQIHTLRHMIREIASLPCHFLCTGHITMDKDEVSGRMIPMIMATGKLKEKIPLLFDEVYVTLAKKTKDGVQYSLLTQTDGFYQARSRLANNTKTILQNEEQDIKNILKKAGMPYEDKPKLQ